VLNEQPTVFMLDIDNTLLDTDRFTADLSTRLDSSFGRLERERYWAHYATQSDGLSIDPTPDLTIDCIGQLWELALTDFHVAATSGRDRVRPTTSESPSQEQI
jgi:hypothetical protein